MIRGNRIFGNARCGIYASGATGAVVTDNLFIDNAMTGMSCWFGNRDSIEKNTFVRNRRSGLEVLGRSSPTVRNNVFFANPTAIATGHVAGEGPGSQYEGPLTVEGNFFWQNESNGFFGAEAERPKKGAATDPKDEAARVKKAGNNHVEDPGFVNAEAGDFTPAPGSPALKAGAGAGSVPAAKSPWPLQPAEVAMRAVLQAEEDDEDEQEGYWEARQKAWTWVEDVMQLGDAARRAKGLAQIEKALAATDRGEILAGLVALSGVQRARFDTARFRTQVLAIARSGPLPLRVTAANALAALGADAEALALLAPVVNEHPESLDDVGWHTWLRLNKGALTGKPADYVLARLQARSSRQVRDLVASLQMARTTRCAARSSTSCSAAWIRSPRQS